MKIKKIFSITLLAVVLSSFLFVSCASIVSSVTRRPVMISSNPSDVNISIRNSYGVLVYRGTTPAFVTLSTKHSYFRGEDYLVTFQKDGYDPRTVELNSRINGWYFGNIPITLLTIVGGAVGFLVVDPLTGDMWTLDDLNVNLQASPLAKSEDGIHIVDINDLPLAARAKLKRLN
jgi:hypothetical protein